MKYLLVFLCVVVVVVQTHAGTTISYTYDKQHRLTSVNYSEAQADAHVSYQYDAANNLDVYVAITDGQYLRSFLYWLSYVVPERWLQPLLASIQEHTQAESRQA